MGIQLEHRGRIYQAPTFAPPQNAWARARAQLLGRVRVTLAVRFYLDICSYCLQQYRSSLSIDHYVPRSFATDRIDDPTNLLLSCNTCGRQKSDYHPNHTARRRLPHDRTGFLVLDLRREDSSQMFRVRAEGSLELHPELGEPERERAAWNVALLRLEMRRILDILEGDLAQRLPMIRAFELPVSARLLARLQSLVDAARA